MALIIKLREKLGKVIVGAVGLAIGSFVLADLLGTNSVLLGGSSEAEAAATEEAADDVADEPHRAEVVQLPTAPH